MAPASLLASLSISLFFALTAAQTALPTVELPYGTWRASSYDRANDIYTFKNIRFAAPPIGRLRWAKPQPPAKNATLQTGIYGPNCMQTLPTSFGNLGDAGKSGSGSGKGSAIGILPKGIDIGGLINGLGGNGEDCLFLDVLVPGKVFKSGNKEKLPVVNWIYGGAYVLGQKSGMYDGTPLVKASKGNMVYVSANYRIGALGFMGGSTLEKAEGTNLGLWDQRAVFEWIQKHISLFGGDPAQVSVWGESAGAGSITFHLSAFGGKQPALFKRAVIQSPAYDQNLDRKGVLEKQFTEFERLLGCTGKGLECMRAVPVAAITKAQEQYIGAAPAGKPAFGPVVDGVLVRQLPSLEFASGNFVKNVESIIATHTADEGLMFSPPSTTAADWNALLPYFWGSSQRTVQAINAQFPISSFKSEQDRLRLFNQWQTFACSVNYIARAYPNITYVGQYAANNGLHGADLSANFFNGGLSALLNPKRASISTRYQSQLVSHALTGSPNTKKASDAIEWPLVKIDDVFGNVLNVTDDSFAIINDDKIKEKDCVFWTRVLGDMTKELGLSPAK